MPKHRWRGSLQSFFGSHIDSEKDEELKGTRTEIEGKVQQILAALKEEDNKGKEPLINLITDFHNHYQSLYARYDYLTDELRKKATGKKGDDSSSYSSDSSDSEDSPNKKGKKIDFENDTAGVKQELELALSEMTELRRKLKIISEEKETLSRERGSALSKIEEAEKIILELNGEAEKFKSENSRLLAENEDLVKELESLRKSQGETSKKLEEVILERDAGVLKVEEEKVNTENLSIINSQLQNEKEAIQLELEALKGDFSSLREKLGSAENEVEKLSRMQKDTDEEKVGLLLKLKEKDDEIAKLLEDHKKLEAEVKSCKENLDLSEKKIEELIQQLEKEVEIKDQEIIQLEDNIEDLKRDLEMKDDEIKTMLENMRNIEVKQRLTSQKLRITEQLLSEKDESYLRKEEKLLEEHKSLEEKALVLSGIITVYKEAHTKIVSEISEKVNNTLAGFDAFHVKFEEDYGHLESRVYEISNELKAATSFIKKEISRLGQQLSVEKNKGLVLENKVGQLENKLQEDEDKRRSLVETVRLREEKVGELEKMVANMEEKMGDLKRTMKEKETGFVNLSEEKREAIRQLSVLIEYHRNRYDDLKGMLAKTRGGINQVAV